MKQLRQLSRMELAQAMGVTLATIARWRQLGLPSVPNGGSLKFQLKECQKWALERGLGHVQRIAAHIHQRADAIRASATIEELEALARLAHICPRWLEPLRAV